MSTSGRDRDLDVDFYPNFFDEAEAEELYNEIDKYLEI